MIIKRRYTKAFVTLENALVRDRRLSLDEHGMLHYLLSLPDDWEVSRANCAKFWGIGRDKAARIFQSLQKCGWAQMERMHAEDGTFLGVRWIITDEPGEEVADASLASDDDADEDHTTPNTIDGSTVTRVDHAPGKAVDGIYKDSTKTDSYENRLPQTGAREKTDLEEPEPVFGALAQQWPPDHVLSRIAAEQVWHRLPRAKRAKADQAVKAYLADCLRHSRKVCDLTTYLREERFEKFGTAKPPGEKFAAKPRTPQWHRWREYLLAKGKWNSFLETQAQNGAAITVDSEWPPALTPEERARVPTGPPVIPELTDEEAADFR